MKKELLCAISLVFTIGVSIAYADGMPPKKGEAVRGPGMLSDFELGKYQYCGEDSDCIAVNNGCCDCANGGADVGINRMHEEKFRTLFDCMKVACTKRAAVPACGSGVVSCVNHKCKYFGPGNFQLLPPAK